jgi:hypothetical protein
MLIDKTIEGLGAVLDDLRRVVLPYWRGPWIRTIGESASASVSIGSAKRG